MERLLRACMSSGVPIAIILVSLAAGLVSLALTPREEEPQIVVPIVDLLIEAPGLSARQVERQITTPVEKLLAQIPGVEHIYSTTRQSGAVVTLRFFVGEDRENALLDTYNKLYSNQDIIPQAVANWYVKPIEVDDVPIVVMSLWSDSPDLYDDFALRRLADEISTEIKSIPQTNRVSITGGRPRSIQLMIDPEALNARQTTPLDLIQALHISNRLQQSGTLIGNNKITLIESGDFLNSVDELHSLIVNVIDGSPVYLSEVAQIIDGPAVADNYTWIDFAPGHLDGSPSASAYPMVAISVAKQTGTNAVWVAGDVLQRIKELKETLLPPEIHVEIIRDYGETANEKVNDLTVSLGIAILTVVVFIGVFLNARAAIVVGLAVPICYGVTLGLDLLFGYTINRVTLFALILSLGLLVDDPITGVDNITRYLQEKTGEIEARIVGAMMEIRTALFMSTVTIIIAFVPLAFITGMMGPYMAPMAFNVPVSVITSTAVAFMVTPWLASRLLQGTVTEEDKGPGLYTRIVTPLVTNPRRTKQFLAVVAVLFLVAVSLPLFRLVPLKLLPFDNKNELQIVLDMQEGTSLESTAAFAASIGSQLRQMPEVKAIAYFVGIPSPMDFNGLVRHYYQRNSPHLADIRLTLVDKLNRTDQSHELVLRIRELLKPLHQNDVQIKVVEVPPGPPVMATLVGEVYAKDTVSYATQRDGAMRLAERLRAEAHVVDVDSLTEVAQTVMRFTTDKQKAALAGISTQDINETLHAANQGTIAGYLNLPKEINPLPIEVRLPQAERTELSDLVSLQVRGRENIAQVSDRLGLDQAPRPLVAIGELGSFIESRSDLPIYHKDLRPVAYVTAEISGRTPAEVIADVVADFAVDDIKDTPWDSRSYLDAGGTMAWSLPEGTYVSWGGEGEWKITQRVFRDMGLGFAFALIAIFFVLRVQVGSSVIAIIIMSAIPLTIIGIMPGFFALNLMADSPVPGVPNPVLFTATAMIGMIALAGIVVRNSLILVEFIRMAREEGADLTTAITRAGEVRMRPILLTAGTTLLGNLIITLDPIFSGLALAIMFGIAASTLFTLLVVPAVYFLIFRSTNGES